MRVALVHDYLTQHGGAERVLEALHDLYPDASVFTSVVDFDALPAQYRGWDIRPSRIARLLGAERYRRGLVPLYPAIFRSFRAALRSFDVVLADSSAWAHHAPAAPSAVHLCYCHTPARFLYGDSAYLGPARIPTAVRPFAAATFAALRRADKRAAARVDRYVANSRSVAERIEAAYGREARVIHPPVDLARFGGARRPPVLPEPWFLVVSRLVPHKRVDLAVDAFSASQRPLKVIGDGRSADALRRRAGPTVEFLGRLDDDAVADYLRRCRGLILPAMEDFGITAVEAQAAGRPVVAFAAGGALETVIPGETGLFFDAPTPQALLAAVAQVEERAWDSERAHANAKRFAKERFHAEIADEVEAALRGRESGTGSRE